MAKAGNDVERVASVLVWLAWNCDFAQFLHVKAGIPCLLLEFAKSSQARQFISELAGSSQAAVVVQGTEKPGSAAHFEGIFLPSFMPDVARGILSFVIVIYHYLHTPWATDIQSQSHTLCHDPAGPTRTYSEAHSDLQRQELGAKTLSLAEKSGDDMWFCVVLFRSLW